MVKQGPSDKPQVSAQTKDGKRHPLFGALKGSVFIPPGVDLTEPADPDWGKVYDDVPAAMPRPSRRRKE